MLLLLLDIGSIRSKTMNDKSKRLARNIGAILTVARWIIIAMLVLLVPAMIFSFFSPNVIPMSVIADSAGTPIDPHASFPTHYVLAYALGNLALVLVITTKLRLMMRTVSSGTPFEAENAVRLRRIAAGMAALALLPILVRPMVPVIVRSSIGMASPNLNLGLWLGALVVLVLAEVFREGARLRDDADMTV